MNWLYIDGETTGLDPQIHELWEIAWAWGNNDITHGFLAHSGISADPRALAMNGYYEREGWVYDGHEAAELDLELAKAVAGMTLVGANPAFDAAFLKQRWGKAPWKYRLLDIEAYAMPAMRLDEPVGLNKIAEHLNARGYDIPVPDHTAAGDVATVRACHLALRDIYLDLDKGKQPGKA